ncbi:BLUF domain-containing protein [Salipiger mucosus]|uniref:BLUF domain-containing protein n=1 Tax=Salipiger mucosus DSM 16094 TaxID=1123237 RepID=S9R4N9_9RHOB|nr:BLUF domain-containing protein [Salipiger mucosus]EPX86897.1 hypothetical protein Salmuc_01548 [Salipiger mucosus DSM 16094]
MIYQLLYTSVARFPRGHSSDLDILHHSMNRNPARGISGHLLRDERGFCHVIEGPKDPVRWLFARIRQDWRHSRVIERMNREVPERSFPSFTMGYGTLNPEDAAFLSRCYLDGDHGAVLAFRRVGRLAAAG